MKAYDNPFDLDQMKKRTKKEVISKFNSIHGESYNYDCIGTDTGSLTKVKIVCCLHGEFYQTVQRHLMGRGCPKCGIKKCSNTQFKPKPLMSPTEFIEKVCIPEYIYCLEGELTLDRKIKILCPVHGVFAQTARKHLSGQRCPECKGKRISKKLILPLSTFINKARIVHKEKYGYSKIEEYLNSHTPVPIECFTHGIFMQRPNNHLSGSGCPVCYESKGEKQIRQHLQNNNIFFIQQHAFENLKHIRCLKFDFYLPQLNTLIEFDGQQHHEYIKHYHRSKEGFLELKEKDTLKTDYAMTHNIRLVRIKFNDNISAVLMSL